jgi:HlyD family secretion protein
MAISNIKKIVFVAVIVIIVVVAMAVGIRLSGVNEPVIEGVVEARTYRASSKIAGRIDSLFVSEGDWVKQGELLYTISTPELQAKLDQVEALRAAAEAINKEVDGGARKEQIDAAKSMWQKAIAGEELVKKSYARVKNLYDKGVATRQQYDEALASYQAMRATTKAARATYDLAVEGATQEQKEAVAAKVREAEGAVREVNAYISDARVYAPVNGRVTDIISEPGELVGAGYPVVAILDLDDRWVVFNVREDDLHGVDVGDRFFGYIPALDTKCKFEVYYIAAEADYATWGATRARGGFDIRTFEVRAHLVDGSVALLPGMSVVVKDIGL